MSNEVVGVEHQPEKVDRLAINIYQLASQFVFGVSHAMDPSFFGVLIHPKQVLAHRGNFCSRKNEYGTKKILVPLNNYDYRLT